MKEIETGRADLSNKSLIFNDVIQKIGCLSEICRKAGHIVLGHYGKTDTAEHKGEIDLVTIADRESERYIIGELSHLFPGHEIIAEEEHGGDEGLKGGGKRKTGTKRNGEFRWLVDPLDGTTNFAHSFPHFCISLGLEYEGVAVFGMVYAPIQDELFIGIKGRGATLNGRRVSVSKVSSLVDSIIATGFPYDRRSNPRNNMELFQRMMTRVQGIRRCGSAALDLCYLACGRLDGFWELRLKPWDMAAGVVIVREAGGRITNIRGGILDIYKDDILASNTLLHREMLDALEGYK